MGRTSTARERLLAAAGELIHNRGYNSLGVAEICERAEVRKGSFYHFFASKQALTVEVVDRHWEVQRARWAAILDGEGSPLRRLELLFLAQSAAQTAARRTGGVVNGCLLANLALELSGQDEVVRRRLDDVFGEQIAMVQAVLEQAVREGTLPAGKDSAVTARALLAQLEGMVLFAKLANDPALLDGLWDQAALLLHGAVPVSRTALSGC
ncbi:TetR/AcrR family transcriptional regulator [Nonomuraea sp. NN258]|uniref:TetR/AcrR family transcriptional regulator n=1 Tax=Nonomuraea antri TaxID=2730852 RepID=UPI001569C540|nr:TetR/AcrR family transcriptional regulator [Nonomuraea antri]NRQ39730.1 TetR/AcrR family transcriptional regulator [Nonomuraea antri]